jgi:serine/threonine-protein kinase
LLDLRLTMGDARDLLGTTLGGHLHITDLLGEGAMGIVYRGVDTTSLREVAVKVLQPSLVSHPEVVARFYREGAAASRVDHENTVRMLGRGEDRGVHYLVMELLDGQSLHDVLTAEGRIAQARAARLIAQICGALAVAHERGIVHRDLKPENIMISGGPGVPGGEQAKLLDFGIAKKVAPALPRLAPVEDSFSTQDLTACGALVGTPEYMAPEQCRGQAVDARTDVYACGVMLYRLVTGRPPFTAEHLLEICQLHLGEPPRPPSELLPGLHPALEATILRAMAKDPAERQQSARELRDDLQRVLDELAAAEAEPTETFTAPELAATIRLEPAAPASIAPAPLLAPEPEPRLTIPTPPPRRRLPAPPLAFWVAFGAGMASTLVTIGLLFGR